MKVPAKLLITGQMCLLHERGWEGRAVPGASHQGRTQAERGGGQGPHWPLVRATFSHPAAPTRAQRWLSARSRGNVGALDTETPTIPPPGWRRARDPSGSRDQVLAAKDSLPSVVYCKAWSQNPRGHDFRGPEEVAGGENNTKQVHRTAQPWTHSKAVSQVGSQPPSPVSVPCRQRAQLRESTKSTFPPSPQGETKQRKGEEEGKQEGAGAQGTLSAGPGAPGMGF